MKLVGPVRRVPVIAWLALALGVPFAVLLVVVSTRQWYPSSDQALEVLQIGEVGSERSPQLGVYSRWGWSHPGPLLFYLTAPLAAVAGNVGVLLSVGTLNAVAVATAAVAAWRRGGAALLTIVVGVLLVLVAAMGIEILIDPWNPGVVVVPLFSLALVCWSVGERDVWFLPAMTLIGSFLVHAHIGVALTVAVLGSTGLALSWRRAREEEPALLGAGWRAPVVFSLGLAVLAWLPPLFEQFGNDPGNLTLLARFAGDPGDSSTGLSAALRVAAAHLGLPPGWVTGLEEHAFDLESSGWTWLGALVVLGGAGAVGWCARRGGAPDAARLMVLGGTMVIAGVLSTAQITGLAFEYLLWPWWSIGAVLWTSILWSTWVLAADRIRAHHAVPAVVTAAGVALLAGLLTWRAARVEVPFENTSEALAELVPDTVAAVGEALPPGEPLVVRWADTRNWGAVGPGMFLALVQEGFDTRVPPFHAENFDEWHTIGEEESAATVLVVESDEFLAARPTPVGAVQVASYDPLGAEERDRHDELWGRISAAVAPEGFLPLDVDHPSGRERLLSSGADADDVNELAELRDGSSSYRVFVLDGPAFRTGPPAEDL